MSCLKVKKSKKKAIAVAGREGTQDCRTLRLPHFLDDWLILTLRHIFVYNFERLKIVTKFVVAVRKVLGTLTSAANLVTGHRPLSTQITQTMSC
jgi:hypothetical protein